MLSSLSSFQNKSFQETSMTQWKRGFYPLLGPTFSDQARWLMNSIFFLIILPE